MKEALPKQTADLRAVMGVCAVLLLLIVLMVFNTRLLPFIDLPNHLAEATIYQLLDEEHALFSQYFTTVPWYFPNTLHPRVTAIFPSVEIGDKIFFSLYLLLMITAMMLVAKQLKGNLWIVVLTFLYAFNYNVTYGFVGYYMSIPFILLLFGFLIRPASWAGSAAIAGLLLLIYFAHAQSALFGLLLVAVISLFRLRWQPGSLAMRAAATLPVFILIVIWWKARADGTEESTLDYMVRYYSNIFLTECNLRLGLGAMDHYHLYAGVAGIVFGAVVCTTILLPLLFHARDLWLMRRQIIRSSIFYPALLLFTVFLCYLLLPTKLPGQNPIAQRFSTYFFLALILVVSAALGGKSASYLKYYVTTAVLLYVVCWGEYFHSFNRDNRGFDKNLLSDVQPGQVMGAVISENDYRDRPVYIHFPNYHIVWNQGLATTKIIDFRFGVVRRGERGEEIPYYNEWANLEESNSEQLAEDLDYLLVKSGSSAIADGNYGEFVLQRSRGDWHVFTNASSEVISQEPRQPLDVDEQQSQEHDAQAYAKYHELPVAK